MIFLSTSSIIIASVAVFLFVVLLLVSLLIFAQSKLIPQGDIKITVNGDADSAITTQAGSNLLNTLSGQKIFLPSACGGGGTCAMCKCQVNSGGGEVLSTEVGHLTRKEQQENWRLACQVKVRENMEIHIPEEIFGIKKWECEVVSNDNVATFIKEFVVKLPDGEHLDFEAGGYIQIDIPPYEMDFSKHIDVDEEYKEDWDALKIWGLKAKNEEEVFRAYSMANHPAEGNIVMLNVRIATPPWDRAAGNFLAVQPGKASAYIFALKPGDKVSISGPYGDFFVKPTKREMMFIGGGAGMAPMRSHLFHQFHTDKTDRKTTFWYGARSKREMFYHEDFLAIEKDFENFDYHVALSEPKKEDNWDGYVGFIHNIIAENYLNKHKEPEEIEYYLCGPPMMNQAIFKMLDDYGVPPENIAFDDFGG
jgi:Na+-transporting NADH:ubiquinone oxidoreductase subunit F